MTCPLFLGHVIKKEKKPQHTKISMGFPDELYSLLLCACGLTASSLEAFSFSLWMRLYQCSLRTWMPGPHFQCSCSPTLLDRWMWSNWRIRIFGFLPLNLFMTLFCLSYKISHHFPSFRRKREKFTEVVGINEKDSIENVTSLSSHLLQVI